MKWLELCGGALVGFALAEASAFWRSGIPRSQLSVHLAAISYNNHESEGRLAAEIAFTNSGNREVVLSGVTVGFGVHRRDIHGTLFPRARSQSGGSLPRVIKPGEVTLIPLSVEYAQHRLFRSGDLIPPEPESDKDLRRVTVRFMTWSIDADGNRFAAEWEPCVLWVDQNTTSEMRCDAPSLDLHGRASARAGPDWMRSFHIAP